MSLSRKAKKKHYGKLDEKKVVDNKQFWKTISQSREIAYTY